MLKDVGVAALKDFIGFLKKEKDFFSLNEKDRQELFQKHFTEAYPVIFVTYFSKVTEDNFLKEIKQALAVFDRSAYADSKNEFINVLAYYISTDFSRQFDQLNISFFFEALPERLKVLENFFPGQSALHQAVRDFVVGSTYQEVGAMANEGLSYIKEVPSIVIQTPVELDSELRLPIRSYILEKYPFSFAEFQVNPQIIGGMRIFAGGKIMDHSWMGKIQAIANLNSVIVK